MIHIEILERPGYKAGTQEDASEFFIKLLENMGSAHEDKPDDHTQVILDDIFVSRFIKTGKFFFLDT